MGTNYPGGLDSLTNPGGGDGLSSPSHAAQHANANDAIEAIQAELGLSPRGSAASVRARLEGIENGSRITLVDGAVTPAKMSRPLGNLLTDNQAYPIALGGFTVVNGTETDPGVYVADGSGAFSVYTSIPAEGGQTYTARSYLSVTGAHSMVMVLVFQNAARETIGTPTFTAEVAPGSAWPPQITAVAPDGTAFLLFTPAITALGASGAVGDSVTRSFSGVWLGAGGVWQMPGRPITNLGLRADPSNSARVQVWNDASATWITV